MARAQENSRHGHVCRPGPFHLCRAYWLEGDVLHWRIGRETGRVPLAGIASMRLHQPLGHKAVAARCVLVEASGRKHRISDRYWFRWIDGERHRWGRHERRTATFRGFAFTLARRLARANPAARLLLGPGWGEWVASVIGAALAVAILLAAAALMISKRSFDPATVAYIVVVLCNLPFLWPVLSSGGPKPLDPNSLDRADSAAG